MYIRTASGATGCSWADFSGVVELCSRVKEAVLNWVIKDLSDEYKCRLASKMTQSKSKKAESFFNCIALKGNVKEPVEGDPLSFIEGARA